MTVKIFLGSIMLLVATTVTGFAYWFFPILSHFSEAMTGKALKDPRGDFQEQANTWLSFLPTDGVQRAVIVGCIIAGYLFLSTMMTLIALRIRRIKENREGFHLSKVHTLHSYRAHR